MEISQSTRAGYRNTAIHPLTVRNLRHRNHGCMEQSNSNQRCNICNPTPRLTWFAVLIPAISWALWGIPPRIPYSTLENHPKHTTNKKMHQIYPQYVVPLRTQSRVHTAWFASSVLYFACPRISRANGA